MTRFRRNAIIVAGTVEVRCPWCGEPQPSPDDSDFWVPSQVITHEGDRVCVSCDEPFRLLAQSRATIETLEAL